VGFEVATLLLKSLIIRIIMIIRIQKPLRMSGLQMEAEAPIGDVGAGPRMTVA
jgi:hypothetical protein